ncbi:hypothetical protein NDU88_005209 [Pleurodeles waltl]|uniref:Uncharacterized protein n=1 Tax=Pleurodeles waltl TaxID=8319 RepID=A0AAV7MVL6_PLEWA|nr:hypothetical protein NDU88_005209 [Pleurodeles waltl]
MEPELHILPAIAFLLFFQDHERRRRRQRTRPANGPAVLDRRAQRSGACLGGALFSGAPHGGARFSGAPHGGARFSGAPHGGARFSGAPHGGARFSGAPPVLLTAGPCSAVLPRCSSRRGHVQRCLSCVSSEPHLANTSRSVSIRPFRCGALL